VVNLDRIFNEFLCPYIVKIQVFLIHLGKADAIKTHHNDSELVRVLRAQGYVVEPLKDFHKDEVRQLGCDLGLPAALVARHPFPGPGLAVRILCADEPYIEKDFSETQVTT